jgi:hypothetical protein
MFTCKKMMSALIAAGMASLAVAAPTTSSFGVVVLPDTQFYSRYATSAEGSQFMNRYGSEPYLAQTQWLADNAKTMGIPFVIHVGDVVDQQNKSAQWSVADAAMKVLESAKVPYSVLAGNHDVINGCGYNGSQSDCTDAQRNLASEPYLKWFTPARAQQQSTFGGRDASGFHEYHVFEAQGQKFMVLSLSWRVSDAGIAWARDVIAANPTTPVIVSLHEFLAIDSDGKSGRETPFSNMLWERLIRDNDQIFMVVSGHNHGSARLTRTNDYGHPVEEFVVDYQMAYQGGNGYMRLFEFDLGANQIKALSFSPWVPQKPSDSLNQFDVAVMTDANNEFVVEMNFTDRFAGFNPDFSAGQPNREQALVEAVRTSILENYDDIEPVDPVLPFDTEDYPHAAGTLAHWRFTDGAHGSAVADGGVVADRSGSGNPVVRAPLVNGALAEDLVWSGDRHALSAADGSACFLANSKHGVRESYFQTIADAPINADTLSSGYTVEAVVKIHKDWTPGNNAWMNVLTRDGNRGDVPGYSGGDPESTPLLFAVSSLREFQWEPTYATPNGHSAKSVWSGEIMADTWQHVAIVNDPVTHDTTMYVAGAPVLRNVQNAPGIATLGLPWVVGAGLWESTRTDGFFGCISEVRISNRALAPSEWLTARKTRVIGSGSRQNLVGTAGDDLITGNVGADVLTGGDGADTFVFRSLRDGTDTITDFTPGEDKLNLHGVLASVGYEGGDPLADGHVRVLDSGSGAVVQIDADGSAGVGAARTLIVLRGLTAQQVSAAGNFLF